MAARQCISHRSPLDRLREICPVVRQAPDVHARRRCGMQRNPTDPLPATAVSATLLVALRPFALPLSPEISPAMKCARSSTRLPPGNAYDYWVNSGVTARYTHSRNARFCSSVGSSRMAAIARGMACRP